MLKAILISVIIGKESGVCGNYYAVSENQTVAIQSTHRIDPSCMMGFFGYINHGNTSVLTVECLRIISVKLPCSSNSTNNIFLVRIFSLIPDYNGTVSIDKDMVSYFNIVVSFNFNEFTD